MQIQQSLQNISATAQVIPPQVLAGLVVGQQIEAAVVQASLAAQLVSLKVGENLVQVTTSVPLKQGQTVQLELVQGGDKPILKLIPPSEAVQGGRRVNAAAVSLVQGQQLTVEVIKLLAENRLLVQTIDPRLSSTSGQPKPVQFNVDIAQLAKSFTVGEKALVEVVSVKPLAIVLKAASAVREQAVIDKIRQLLPQLEAKPQLNHLTTALKALSLPSSVQSQLQQLVGNVLDKQAVNQPQALRQALESSGVFTERQLLKPSAALSHDFKANLLKVAAVIEGELTGKIVLTKTGEAANKPLGGGSPLSSLSTGSLGQSQVRVPGGAVPNATPLATGSGLTEGGGGSEVKRNPLSSPFSFQNTASQTAVKTDIVVSKPTVANTTAQTALTSTVPDSGSGPKLTLLSAILQAIGAYNATPKSVSVLNTSPLSASLPSALPAFLESVLTSQQAAALAQALNKSISVEQLRASGRFDVLVLQGLLKEVESLHARVQLNQFSMLKEPDSPAAPMASWLIDLPVKDKQGIDFIQLQIDQFKNQNDDEDYEIWNVQLRLDTQKLGPLQATVTMHIDDIKIVLRAERP